ncbi:MAG: hypothetical protein R3B53_01920 [Candidatus Paceibacterota bacterium]
MTVVIMVVVMLRGEEPCVPLISTTTEARYEEADALALQTAKDKALRTLAKTKSETIALNSEETVKVGQIVMFVDLKYRYLDEKGMNMLAALLATASTTDTTNNSVVETVWERLVNLANNFVDGVLSIFKLKAEKVETSELCVDGVCINASDLRQLLNNTGSTNQSNTGNQGGGSTLETPVEEENDVPPVVSDTGTTTATGTEPVVDEAESEEDGDLESEQVENTETEDVEVTNDEVVVEETTEEESANNEVNQTETGTATDTTITS